MQSIRLSKYINNLNERKPMGKITLNVDNAVVELTDGLLMKDSSDLFKSYKVDIQGKIFVVKAVPAVFFPQSEKGVELVKNIFQNIHTLHEQIERIVDIVRNDEFYFFVREYVHGISLKDLLDDVNYRKKLKVVFSIKIGMQLAEILGAFHGKGFIHRNIIPSNIIFRFNSKGILDFENPMVTIVDFQKAQFNGMNLLSFNKIPYSLYYSPPEQVFHYQHLMNSSTDFYNTTACLYELYVKEKPFYHKLDTMAKVLQLGHHLLRKSHMSLPYYAFLHKGTHKYKFNKPPHMYNEDERLARFEKGQELRFHSSAEYIAALESVYENIRNEKGTGAKAIGGFRQLKVKNAFARLKRK